MGCIDEFSACEPERGDVPAPCFVPACPGCCPQPVGDRQHPRQNLANVVWAVAAQNFTRLVCRVGSAGWGGVRWASPVLVERNWWKETSAMPCSRKQVKKMGLRKTEGRFGHIRAQQISGQRKLTSLSYSAQPASPLQSFSL